MNIKASKLKSNWELLLRLSKNDLKSKYAGSFFGIIWSFIQPLVTIAVFYIVFQVGFRNPPVNNIEFVLWISPGYWLGHIFKKWYCQVLIVCLNIVILSRKLNLIQS